MEMLENGLQPHSGASSQRAYCLVQKESKFNRQHGSNDGTGTPATVQSL